MKFKNSFNLKRKMVFAVLTLFLFASLCVNLSRVQGSPQVEQAGPVVIHVQSLAAGGMADALAGGIAKFNEEYSGRIKAEVIGVPYAVAYEKIMADFTAGAETYDVIAFSEQWVGSMARYFTSLDDLIKNDPDLDFDDIPSGAWKLAQYKDVTYGVPIRIGSNILFMRKDLFVEAGLRIPPSDLNEYLEAAKKLTRDTNGDGSIDIYGTQYSVKDAVTAHGPISFHLFAFGGDWLNESMTEGALSSRDSLQAMKFMVDMYNKHKVVPPECIGWSSWVEGVEAAAQGRTAMYNQYSPRVLIVENPEQSKTAGKWAYSTMPLKKGMEKQPGVFWAGGWQYAIVKTSDYKEAAWEYIKFMASYEIQKYMALEFANGPTRTDVILDPDFAAGYPAYEALATSLKYNRTTPPHPRFSEIANIATEELHAALVGRKSTEDAMRDADRRINEILK